MIKNIIKVLEKNKIIIDSFSITKFYEIYLEKLNSLKSELNYTTEIETIKKNLIIPKDREEESISLLKNLINKDKNRKMDELAMEYRNLDNQIKDEDMEIVDDDYEN